MKYKVGQVLYDVNILDNGKIEIEEGVVRTIRGGYVYAIYKYSFTWGKLSKKHGHYGWLDPIPYWCRRRTKVGEKFATLYTTKRQAIQATLKTIKDYPLWLVDDPDAEEKIVKTLKRMLAREKNKRAKK